MPVQKTPTFSRLGVAWEPVMNLAQKAVRGAKRVWKWIMNVVDNNTPIGVYKGVKGFLKDNKDAQDSQVNWGKAIEASIKQRQKMHDTIMSKLKNVK